MSACFRFLNAVGVIENLGIGGVSKAPRLDCVTLKDPLVRVLFDIFDADRDDKLNKEEYKAYLRGIGFWGTGSCTDESYDAKGWQQQCNNLKSSTDGISFHNFENILYGKGSSKCHRRWESRRNVQEDLHRSKAATEV